MLLLHWLGCLFCCGTEWRFPKLLDSYCCLAHIPPSCISFTIPPQTTNFNSPASVDTPTSSWVPQFHGITDKAVKWCLDFCTGLGAKCLNWLVSPSWFPLHSGPCSPCTIASPCRLCIITFFPISFERVEVEEGKWTDRICVRLT